MVLKIKTPGTSSHRKRSPQSVHGGHHTPFSVHPFQPSQLPWRELFVDVTDEKPNDTERNRKWGKTQKNIIIYLENILKSTCGLDIFAQTAMFGCLLQLIVKDVNAVSGMTPSQTYPHV